MGAPGAIVVLWAWHHAVAERTVAAPHAHRVPQTPEEAAQFSGAVTRNDHAIVASPLGKDLTPALALCAHTWVGGHHWEL